MWLTQANQQSWSCLQGMSQYFHDHIEPMSWRYILKDVDIKVVPKIGEFLLLTPLNVLSISEAFGLHSYKIHRFSWTPFIYLSKKNILTWVCQTMTSEKYILCRLHPIDWNKVHWICCWWAKSWTILHEFCYFHHNAFHKLVLFRTKFVFSVKTQRYLECS